MPQLRPSTAKINKLINKYFLRERDLYDIYLLPHDLNVTTQAELEQTPRDSGGQESLAGCSLWGHKGSDVTEQLTLQIF